MSLSPPAFLNTPQPKINKTSAKLAQQKRPQNVPIEEYLSYQGQIYQLKAKVSQQGGGWSLLSVVD
jgi:hypothetical protein